MIRRSKWWFLLIALTIVGLVGWRLGGLQAFSLSNDEGAYLMWAWLVHSGHPLYSQTISVSAPLFIVLLDLAFAVGGVSLVTGRVLVLVFFCISLVGLVGLSRTLRLDRGRDERWWGLAATVSVLAFGLAPLGFRLSRMAMGEMPAVALAILSVAWAAAYWRSGRWVWLALSGLAFCLSLLVKALNPLLVLPILWLIWDRNRGHTISRRILPMMAWGVCALVPIGVTLLAYDPADLYDQAVAFRFELRQVFPWQPAENLTWIVYFVRQQWGIVVLAMAGLVLLVLQKNWSPVILLGLWLVGGLATTFGHSPLFPHHTIILLPPLALLGGQAVAGIAAGVDVRRWLWAGLGALGVAGFLLAIPAAVRLNQEVLDARFGREAEAAALLRQVTRPDEDVISDNLLLAFVAGRQTPPGLGDVAQVAIDSGRQTGQRLIALSQSQPVAAVANWALRLPHMPSYLSWVEDHYLVRRQWDDFHVIYFARKPDPGSVPRLDPAIDFEGGIRLVGDSYRLRSVPENAVWVDLYWQAGRPILHDYTVFVHLYDTQGRLVASHDGPPFYGYLPTSQWPVNGLMPDRHDFDLPVDLPAGDYTLAVGLYDPENGQRLPVLVDGEIVGDEAVLAQLSIPPERDL